MRKLTIAAIITLLMVGCASNYERDYDRYNEQITLNNAQLIAEHQRAEAERQTQTTALSGTAGGCLDDRCREHVAALTAVVLASGGGSRAGSQIALHQPQAPQYREHPFWSVARSLIQVGLPVAGQAFANFNSRRIAESDNDALLGVVQSQTDAAVNIAGSIAGSLGAGLGIPTTVTNIGGDYLTIGGDQTTVGGHQAGGNIAGRDNAGGDLDAHTIGRDDIDISNSGRFQSDGPIDQSMSVPPPVPETPPESVPAPGPEPGPAGS